MRIKVGDTIKTRVWSLDKAKSKMGVITSINIALDYHDKKAEYGIEVKQYDTELDYIGTVSYDDDNNNSHWTYFNQIISVIPQENAVVETYDLDKFVGDIINMK
jgi:hypothetical protein